MFRKLVGDLHLEAGDHASAGEQYFRLVEEAPEQLASLLAFGERCQSDGRHVVAIAVFELASALSVPVRSAALRAAAIGGIGALAGYWLIERTMSWLVGAA